VILLNEYEKASTGCRGFFHVRDEYHPKIKNSFIDEQAASSH